MPVGAPRAACLGGGGGLVQVARGLTLHGVQPTAVVAVTDNGRSTGLVRRLFDVPAPGDLRSILAAFSTDPLLQGLFEYRLDTPAVPELTGTAFGNLVIGALTKYTGRLDLAIERVSQMLGVAIPVLPISLDNVQLAADLIDGQRVVGEVDVRRPGKPPIRQVLTEPAAAINPAAAAAIRAADLVTIGPGSLFTSILACLAIRGVPEALGGSNGRRVYVANTTTQPGQSDDLPLEQQIALVLDAAGGAIDAVLINSGQPDPETRARHLAAGRHLLTLDRAAERRFSERGLTVVYADLIETDAPERALWQKEDTIRHDPIRLGQALTRLINKGERNRGD